MGNQKYKQKHRELGLCVDCSEKVYPDHSRCLVHMRSNARYSAKYYQDHLEHYREIHKKIKANRTRDGCCKDCSAPLDLDADAGFINCMNCREGTRKERSIHGNLIVQPAAKLESVLVW
jgi:hypothetical protein